MPMISDNALDACLDYVRNNAGALHLCSQEPANYTEATSTYSLGNKASPTINAPQNGDVSGRKIVVAAISDGSVTGTGTASHEAIVKTTVTTELLTAHALASSQSVTNGNTFTLTAHDIELPDPT